MEKLTWRKHLAPLGTARDAPCVKPHVTHTSQRYHSSLRSGSLSCRQSPPKNLALVNRVINPVGNGQRIFCTSYAHVSAKILCCEKLGICSKSKLGAGHISKQVQHFQFYVQCLSLFEHDAVCRERCAIGRTHFVEFTELWQWLNLGEIERRTFSFFLHPLTCLLQTEQASKSSQLDVHSSFATSVPFVLSL